MATDASELVRFETRGDALIASARRASISGEDGTTIGNAIIDEVQSMGGAVRVVALDLSGVTSVNSVLLGAMVTVLATLRRYNVSFCMLGVPGPIREMLELTKLDRVFRIVGSRDELAE